MKRRREQANGSGGVDISKTSGLIESFSKIVTPLARNFSTICSSSIQFHSSFVFYINELLLIGVTSSEMSGFL